MSALVILVLQLFLLAELVTATEECSEHQFQYPFYPGKSCEEIYNMNPESRNMSGYYWILPVDGPRKVYCAMNYIGSCLDTYNNHPETRDKSGYYHVTNSQWTYCDMSALATCIAGATTGGWRRIANINVSATGTCPSGWRIATNFGVSYCRVVSDVFAQNACSSTYFSTSGTSYQRVCGRAKGYHKGETQAFFANVNWGVQIDDAYADGLCITYNDPRQHIWTYAAGQGDSNVVNVYNCPCNGDGTSPSFVGNDYYCSWSNTAPLTTNTFNVNDPLWDRTGCVLSSCCDNPAQPWFYRELNGPTTSDIEARLCSFSGFAYRAALLVELELYVQ